MITDQERETALALLARSRTAVLNAVDGVTEEQARWKHAPERWSILEYIEHLAVSDDALVGMVKRSLQSPAKIETGEERRAREQKIRETPIPRGANRAPEILKPVARFDSLADAVSAFLAARERTIAYAQSTTDDLRSHYAPHSVLGSLDGYQWLCGNARHAESHAAHVMELRGMPDFPRG
ncbi:MAG: DinB family protein [Bryobacteraceae bacterium]